VSPRLASIRRTCQIVMKAVPTTMKPTRITAAAISPPFDWEALLVAELVEVADAEVELAVPEKVEAAEVEVTLEGVGEADAEGVVAVVVATTPLRSFVNGSSAGIETTQIARRNRSRQGDRILRTCQVVEMLGCSSVLRCEPKKHWRGHRYHTFANANIEESCSMGERMRLAEVGLKQIKCRD
jgi:hypothetical protein